MSIKAGLPTSTSRALSTAIVCGAIISSGDFCGVSAFSPPSHRLSPRIANIGRGININQKICAKTSSSTSLSYKHLDSGDDDDDSVKAGIDAHKNETDAQREFFSMGEIVDQQLQETRKHNRNINVSSSDVTVEINKKKDVIYYNDLDPLSSSDDITSDTDNISLTSTDNVHPTGDDTNSAGNELITELNEAIKYIKIKVDNSRNMKSTSTAPQVIDPSYMKPKKYVPPIQLIKKVPRVEPIHMSTAMFLKLIGDPQWPSANPASKQTPSSNNKDTAASDDEKKPVIENWKTKMEKNKKPRTAFMATNYLEALGAGSDTHNKNGDSKEGKNDLMKALRAQQANLRQQQLKAQQQAIHEATRRTSPNAVHKARIEKEHNERKQKEREKLERLYVERKERIDAKKRNEQRYLEEKKHQRALLEEKAREREEEIVLASLGEEEEDVDAKSGADESGKEEDKKKTVAPERLKRKRGIPILDRPSFHQDVPPLLVGSTLTFQYSDLTPFQHKSIEIAQLYHCDHVERTKVDGEESGLNADDDGGIQASPIIAVTDSFTNAAAAEVESVLSPQQKEMSIYGTPKKFATLASIDISYDSISEEPTSVKFTGVGRVFLRDYFSSRDAGLTEEEEELNQLLAKMAVIHREANEEEEVELIAHMEEECLDDEEDYGDHVIMAEFDLFLDDSTRSSLESSKKYGEDVTRYRASSMHAITELYRAANKVYRLHEERKKIVAGLRAAEARLRLGKGKTLDEECLIEFEDCDGFGFISGMVEDMSETLGPVAVDNAPRHHLETLDNYGLESYGILSTIPDLTGRLMSHLEPYYSPSHREREEHEAEVASMVVFQTLQEYATSEEVAMALLAPSATQRLDMAYTIMMRHRNELVELVKLISNELNDCGEECTDLW